MRHLYILVLAVALTSCRTTAPVLESVSESNYNYIKKDDSAIQKKPDSSLIKYLIECQETSEGYLAVIRQITEQQQGDEIPTPTSEIKGDTLISRIFIPGKKIYVPVYRYYSTTIKAAVYIKYTNYLTGFQWFQIWGFRIFAGILLLIFGMRLIRAYTGRKLPWQK